MNITRLTLAEAITLLDQPAVDQHQQMAGVRFAGSEPGTIDLIKYCVWLVDGKPRAVGRQRQFTELEQKAKKRAADLERVNAATRAANDIGEPSTGSAGSPVRTTSSSSRKRTCR